jgi:hypothetical protein
MKTAPFRVLLTLVALVSPAMRAQAPPAGMVAVDFLAIGKDGQPVTDLKPEEVQVRVANRARTIKNLQLVRAATAAAAASAAAPAKPAGDPPPPPFGTNVADAGAASGGRTIFLVVEDQSFRPGRERQLKDSLLQYIGSLSEGDRVSFVTMPQPMLRVDPTTDHGKVRETVAKLAGQAPQSETEDDRQCRSRETLDGLRGLLGSMAGASSPCTVLFFSSRMSGATRTTGEVGSGKCDLSTDHFNNVGVAASAARAIVYVVQADETVTDRSDGLENLAGVTSGAQVLRLGGATESPLVRIARETSASWVAMFEPEANERGGGSHRLELRVTRPDVATRAGTQLAISRSGGGKSVSARDMMREATIFRDLPLRIAGFVSREGGDKLKVVTLAEPADPSVKIKEAIVGLYDAKGKLTAQSTAPSEALGSFPVMSALVVPAGTYRLRLAATDASGRAGSADMDVNVELVAAGDLKLSALVLGNPAGGFKPMLQFSNEENAVAMFELYGKPATTMPLRFELAATATGPALHTAQPQGSGTKEPDRFTVSATFPIAALAPGDYVVRATVGEGAQQGVLLRTLRKVK